MSYDDAIKAIGHCELTPYEYGMQHNYHCDYYYPDHECLSKCKVLKK